MFYNCQIVFNHNNCLNGKKASDNICRLCIDSCPHQAISLYFELDAKRCTECGICMAVCPSDGFVLRSSDQLHEYIRASGNVILNCPQAIPAGQEIPCLGIIDRDLWLTLMLYAREKEVTIFTGVCADCPDKNACRISVEMFKEVHNAWKGHPPIGIKVAPDEGNRDSDLGETVLSQRQKFEAIFAKADSEEMYHIPKTRQLLSETWKSRQSEVKALPLPVLNVNEYCTDCGECPTICPQEALTKRENEEQLSLIYEPLKCVLCQRCISICRSKALSIEVKSLTYRLLTGKVLLYQGKRRFCSQCGTRVFDNLEPPMCIDCLSQRPTLDN
ncbi:4Fe-4S binding protein [Desulfosporosinus sp. SYSU MS00001]|uniref:4Fe-4S binding protein n=1 Tax=Desulfosporosinus sp. SYSU MS00001 TaxID=3416284 RepID=UPI003CEEBF8A